MTPEEAARRAIACTATGALSGLPKWTWPEDAMLVDKHGCRRRLNYYDKPAEMLALGRVPDFTHEPTVLAMLPLVRRAWLGHRVTLVLRENGNVNLTIDTVAWLAQLQHRANAGDVAAAKAHAAALSDGYGTVFLVCDVPLYEALTLALEAAPEKS